MSEPNPARIYEDLFVPAEFASWAPRVAAAAKIGPGDRVLDVACGTGVLARHVAGIVEDARRVAGIDPSANMLAIAREIAPDVAWHLGTAEALPFADETFDAVVSQFGLMFFTDRTVGLRELRRVLRPGGRMAVAVWDTLEHTPAYATLIEMLEDVVGPSSADALRAPFSLGDTADLAQTFDAAGLGDAVITTHHGTGHFASIRAFVGCEVNGWLPAIGIRLDDDDVERLVSEAEHRLASYVRDAGMYFDAPAHIVRWTKPAKS